MAKKLTSIPRALWPHHDGSALYVTNQKPALLEKIKLKIRVHLSFGKVKSIQVRFSESGEAFPTPPAKLLSTKDGWAWYEATIVMHNPYMNYRWYLECDAYLPHSSIPC